MLGVAQRRCFLLAALIALFACLASGGFPSDDDPGRKPVVEQRQYRSLAGASDDKSGDAVITDLRHQSRGRRLLEDSDADASDVHFLLGGALFMCCLAAIAKQAHDYFFEAKVAEAEAKVVKSKSLSMESLFPPWTGGVKPEATALLNQEQPKYSSAGAFVVQQEANASPSEADLWVSQREDEVYIRRGTRTITVDPTSHQLASI